MRRKNSDYYIGLDIGTNSVGWAVANPDYIIPKFHGHKMWGSRLFDEAKTAEERRIHRVNRRRLERRKNRLNILQDLFKDEMAKVDNTFFLRLQESKFKLEDKNSAIHGKNLIFAESSFGDKEFYNKYKTLYHLRNHLMHHVPDDIRELYLAVHHILKYRGHFLYLGELNASNNSMVESLKSILLNLDVVRPKDEFDYTAVATILKERNKTKNDRKKAIKQLAEAFWKDTKKDPIIKNKIIQVEHLAGLALGLKADLAKLLNVDEFSELEKSIKEISFSKGDYEEKRNDYESAINEYIHVVDQVKEVYDAVILSSILKDYKTISAAKMADYESHSEDLLLLKGILKPYPILYNAMFKDVLKDKLTNYVAYIGAYPNGKKTTAADFYKYVKDTLKHVEESAAKNEVLKKIELETFMPLLRSKDNSTIPYQMHKAELVEILDKAATKFAFLNKISDGLSVKEKIIMLMEFRIPYYVGPLNTHHNHSTGWVVRKSEGKVYPWNFYEKIDEKASAEAFITNLTNKCTYLIGEDVLPKESILYSYFSLLNELNNIKIDNQPLPITVKKQYIDEVFRREHKKQTKSRILDFLKTSGFTPNKLPISSITGVDDCIKGDLKSYRDMFNILGDGFDVAMAENIIRWVTLFGDGKKILEEKIRETYSSLTVKQINDIKKLKYSAWGKLSKAFLRKIKGISPEGREESIISCLENSNLNLMQILSLESYQKSLEVWNQEHTENKDIKVEYDLLDDLHISPSVKRAVWQSIQIVDELVKINGYAPKKIFVEVTRTNQTDKTKKDARKKRLFDLYQAIAKEEPQWADAGKSISDWKNTLNSEEDGRLRSKKLYLYYTQMGRCMYSNDPIHLERLFTSDYDIDHIYPRSATKDNSWDNLVLVKSELNRKKTDIYPLEASIQRKNKEWWGMLKHYKLISDRKYERLVRTSGLTSDELAGFIARQLVETSQSTKAVTQLLKRLYPDTEIVFSKAENISEFRQNNKFIKVRDLNDYHHAKDAYLNIVVGNVYHEKYTKNPRKYIENVRDEVIDIKERRKRLSMNHLFDYDLVRNGKTIWKPSESMAIVTKMMNSNDVRVTKKLTIQKGALYNASITKANKAKMESNFPLKMGDKRLLDISKYGGYENVYNAFYSIFKCKDKKNEKVETILIAIPIYMANLLNSKEDYEKYAMTRLDINSKYSQVDLVYKQLPINSVVRINGYDYYVGGKTGNNICIDSAISLVLDLNATLYLKAICRVCQSDTADYIFENDEYLSQARNFDFYKILVSKMQEPIFMKKSKNKYVDFLENSCIKKFIDLSGVNQCFVLLEMLNMLTDKKSSYDKARLQLIGITMSRTKKSMNLTKLTEFLVKEQSITGLFNHVIKII